MGVILEKENVWWLFFNYYLISILPAWTCGLMVSGYNYRGHVFWIKHGSCAYSATSEKLAILIYTFTFKILLQVESFLVSNLVLFLTVCNIHLGLLR